MLSKVSPIGLGSKLVVIYAPPQALPPPHQISHLFSPVHRPRQHPSLGKYFFIFSLYIYIRAKLSSAQRPYTLAPPRPQGDYGKNSFHARV